MALLLSVGLLAGCGSSGTINQLSLQRMIGRWAVRQADVRSPVVRCPADVPIKAGSTFHCIVRAGGQAVRVVVTIENSDGYVTWVEG